MSARKIVSHFDTLINCGLKVIPLRENSKEPMQAEWNKIWSKHKIRFILEKNPNANLGVLLGDIVDVEGDSPKANRTILDLIGDYPHPSYTSTKSIHHLFINPDPELRILKYDQIEFRGKKHQSVLPPSQNSGNEYKWIKPSIFPIPPMPERLLEFYLKLKDQKKNRIKKNHMEVFCCSCEKKIQINKNRFPLELKVFKSIDQKWACLKCREIDIRSACRQLKKKKYIKEY